MLYNIDGSRTGWKVEFPTFYATEHVTFHCVTLYTYLIDNRAEFHAFAETYMTLSFVSHNFLVYEISLLVLCHLIWLQ